MNKQEAIDEVDKLIRLRLDLLDIVIRHNDDFPDYEPVSQRHQELRQYLNDNLV